MSDVDLPESARKSLSLGGELHNASNLQDLLERTLRAACVMLSAAAGTILLNDTNRLIPKASFAEGEITTPPQTFDTTAFNHYLTQPDTPPEVTREGDQHHLTLPMTAQGKLLAIVHITRPTPFTPQEENILIGMANYSALGIANARLVEQSRTVNRELQILVEAGNAVSMSLELPRVLKAIAQHMMRALNADLCLIAEWERTAGHLHYVASHIEAMRQTLIPSDTVAYGERNAALNDHMMYRYTNPDAPLLKEEQVSRLLGVPIQAEGSTLGIVESSSQHSAQPFERSAISASVRAAMHLARSPDHVTRSHLQQAAQIAAQPPDIDKVAVFIRYAAGLMRVYDYGFTQMDIRVKLADVPNLHIVLEELRVAELRRAHPRTASAEAEQMAAYAMPVMIAIPLVLESNAVGLVQLFFQDEQRDISRREIGLATSLAKQGAIALENAHLVRDLQASLETQQATQAQLVRAARLSVLGELSATLAHQISNPLTIILGDAEILMEDLTNPADLESAEAIFKAGKRARQVVERILKAARHEEVPRVLDVNKTIRETLELLSPQLNRRGTTLHSDLAAQVIPVKAVPGQLEDVWSNLLINARDAVQHKAQTDITISSRVEEDEAVVTVQDSGEGIPADKLKDLFNPLFTTKPMGQGTGLGLYIVQQIIDTIYGDITIDSTPGVGTTVTITLPLTDDDITEEG